MKVLEKVLQEIEEKAVLGRNKENGFVNMKYVMEIFQKHLSCENNEETVRKSRDDGWIPVEDGLPEENEEDYYDSVIVTLSDGTVRPGVYRNIEDEWYVENEEGVKTYRFSNEVIAWQHLPKPYKQPVEYAEEKSMREREEFFSGNDFLTKRFVEVK